MAPDAIVNQPAVQIIRTHHVTPADAARVFEAAKPRLAVFTHFAFPPDRATNTSVTAADVLVEARKYYRGRMEAGEDLMRIIVSDSIRVERRPSPQ